MWAKNMKPLGEIEEELATKAEPVLGFKPSSKFKRGPIGILIYVLCGIVAFIPMRSAGVFWARTQGPSMRYPAVWCSSEGVRKND